MATSTTNLGLTKPSVNDAADIGVLNSNFDKIDAKIPAAGAAPSGYGLGAFAQTTITDCNEANKNGWYATSSTCANQPWTGGSWLFVEALNNFYVIQYISTEKNGCVTCRRIKDNNVWGAWEYVNPPMQLGVEYRTTERWNGNVVYKKLIHCGKGPAGGALNLFPNTGTNSVFIDVSCKARSNSGWGYFLDHFLTLGEYGSGDCVIALNAAKDLSAYDIYLEVKYYKA